MTETAVLMSSRCREGLAAWAQARLKPILLSPSLTGSAQRDYFRLLSLWLSLAQLELYYKQTESLLMLPVAAKYVSH